ncbi:MAG: hypothetical protein ACOWYE_13245, partial [Desulfatiglandales bacterium]
LWKSFPVSWSRYSAYDKGSLIMGAQGTGSAKKNLPYHNTLILQESKNLTVKDQLGSLAAEQTIRCRCRPLRLKRRPENLRYHAATKRYVTDLLAYSQPFTGSRHGQ